MGMGTTPKIEKPGYILVAVKLPEPEQPELIPVSVQVPVMVLFFAVPCRLSVFPLGFPDLTISWKAPVTLPLKFPLRAKEADSVSSETKQGVWVVKLRLVTLTELPLICVKVVVKAKACELFELFKVAVQLPLMLLELLELLLPHPPRTIVSPSRATIAPLYICDCSLSDVFSGSSCCFLSCDESGITGMLGCAAGL